MVKPVCPFLNGVRAKDFVELCTIHKSDVSLWYCRERAFQVCPPRILISIEDDDLEGSWLRSNMFPARDAILKEITIFHDLFEGLWKGVIMLRISNSLCCIQWVEFSTSFRALFKRCESKDFRRKRPIIKSDCEFELCPFFSTARGSSQWSVQGSAP